MRSLLLALALVPGAASQSVKSCGGSSDHLKNPIINLSPDPPVKGGSLTVTVTGELDEEEGTFNSNLDLQVQALRIIHAGMKGAIPLSLSPNVVKGPFELTVGPIDLPTNIPGALVIKGPVHVTNANNEPITCIEFDLTIGGKDDDDVETQVASSADVPSVSTIESCGTSSDHAPDFKIATDDTTGVITMTGTLDEDVTKAALDLDVKLKVLFVSVPLQMHIPLTISKGFVNKGAITATVGPSTVALSPNPHAHLTGTAKFNDANGEQITCLNVDTVLASEVARVESAENCKPSSHTYCCSVGTPCDCTKGTTSSGQCNQYAYAFCCSVGTPCDCSQPPLGNTTQSVVV